MFINDIIGYRENHYKDCLPYLEYYMTNGTFNNLKFVEAPEAFDESANLSKVSQF